MGIVSSDSSIFRIVFGGGVVKNIVNYLNGDLKWLGDGLTVAGAVLPAVGFAILLRYLPLKTLSVFHPRFYYYSAYGYSV